MTDSNEYLLRITAALTSGNCRKISDIRSEIRIEDPFIFSLVGDSLAEAAESVERKRRLEILTAVVTERIESLANWSQTENETVSAIRAGKIEPLEIKAHTRLPQVQYDQFYSDQSNAMAKRAIASKTRSNTSRNSVRLNLNSNINHSFRYAHAISLMENLLGIINTFPQSVDRPVRWLDIGCGTGHFVNGVDPSRFGLKNWQIIGCDMQSGKIALAQSQAAKGRTFAVSDAFQMLDEFGAKGESFDLVSMFEFLEHLDDPLKFIRQLHSFNPTFVMAASPLGQMLNRPMKGEPDRIHFWSFSRHSWKQMFEVVGFKVVYSSELFVGSYLGGLDWLSMICGPRDALREKRQELC